MHSDVLIRLCFETKADKASLQCYLRADPFAIYQPIYEQPINTCKNKFIKK